MVEEERCSISLFEAPGLVQEVLVMIPCVHDSQQLPGTHGPRVGLQVWRFIQGLAMPAIMILYMLLMFTDI